MPSKSRLGQNFLRDEQAIRRIVAALGDCSERTVVEIGPGMGAITRELAAIAQKVLALEVDPELAASGRWVAFRTGKTIRLLDAATRVVSVALTTPPSGTQPRGLSISGRRLAWAEKSEHGSRIRAITLRP